MLFFLLLLGIFLQACLSSELLSRSSNKTHVRQGRHFFGENSNMINLQSEYLGFLRDAVLNVHYNPYPDSNDGSSFPPNSNSLSMAGRRRLDNYAALVATVVHDKIPGHIIETGVWRGGGSILAAKTIEILGESKQRKVYFADSFKGIPPVSATDSKSTAGDKDAHSLEILNNNSVERVQSSVQSFGVNMSHVSFVVGYFNESLPLLFQSEPTLRFSVLRLDGDTYFQPWMPSRNFIHDLKMVDLSLLMIIYVGSDVKTLLTIIAQPIRLLNQ